MQHPDVTASGGLRIDMHQIPGAARLASPPLAPAHVSGLELHFDSRDASPAEAICRLKRVQIEERMEEIARESAEERERRPRADNALLARLRRKRSEAFTVVAEVAR